MDLEDEIQETFLKIRPICVDVMNYIQWAHLPKVDNRLITLYNALTDIKKSEILIQLEDYICFPLVQIINDKTTSQQNIEIVLKCLTYIIEHVNCVLSVELFQNFLVASTKCASQESNSEELKYSAIHCILCLIKFYPKREEIILKNEDLFKKKNMADRNNLNSKLYKMLVAHIISICLDLAQKEKLLILRLEALEVLRYLVELLNYNAIVKFVPGIVSNLLKTCIESSNDNHRVLVNSLIVLEQVICKAFNDNINSQFLKKNDSLSWNDLQNLYKDKNKNDEISINSNNFNNSNNNKTEKDKLKDVEKNEIEKMFDQQDLKMESEGVTEEWLNISSVKILNLLNALINIRGHSHQNVRKQFILFSKSIIQQCKLTLHLCMETLVEILVYYLNDEIEEISVLCLETINEVSKEFKNNQQFLELLKKNFEKLILSFPRLLTSSSDKTKLEMINLANGYLILLKDEATILIQTSIELLANSLIEILTFDISDVRLIEDRYNYNNNQVDILEVSKNTNINDIELFFETKEDPDDQILGKEESKNRKEVEENSFYRFSSQYYRYSRFFPKKNFKYIHDDKVIKVLSQLCHLIGYYGDISFLIDYLLNTYIINNNFTDNTITPIYLLNEVCMGGYHRLNNDKKNVSKKEIISNRIELYFNLLENILFEYTHSKVLDMPTSLMDEELFSDIDNSNRNGRMSTTLTNRINNPYHPHIDNEQSILSENKIESFNEIILKNCLILEGISTISLIMRDNFKIHLMETLYILLEKLGDINRTISDLAMSCLNLVSKACSYTSTSELILDNVDYIINIVTQKLRYIEYNIKAPRVLKAAIEVSQYPIIQYMNDTIEELCEILDQNKTNPGLGCLVIDVFQALMTVLNRYSLLQQENNNNDINNHSNKNEKENDTTKPNGVNDQHSENKKEMETKKSSNNPTNDAFIEKMIQSNIFQQADPEIQSFFLKNLSLNSSDDEEEEKDDDDDDDDENNNNNNNNNNHEKNSSGKSSDTHEGKINNSKSSNSINKIENYFKNYHKKKEDKNNFENEKAIEENDQHPREHEEINIEEKNKNEEGEEEEGIDEEESVEMSYDQKLCLRVVKETSYYINSDSPELRSKSLRVIKASFQMLGYYPKELYPMVHQLWPTLLKRLNDPANHVIKDTIQLINEMINTTTIGADFLNRAVADELLPILFRYIEEYNEKIMPIEVFKRAPNTKRRKDFEKVRYQKDSQSLFGDDVMLLENKDSLSDIEIKNKYSNLNKLQISILETLSFIIYSLEKDNKSSHGGLKLEEYHRLEKLLLPSLSNHRNIELVQKKAIQVYKNICLTDEDGVWLIMTTINNIIQNHRNLYDNDNDNNLKIDNHEKLKIQDNLNQLFNIQDPELEVNLNSPLGWKKEVIYMNNLETKNKTKQQLLNNQDEDIKKIKENKYINWVSSMEKNIQVILSYIS